MSAIDVTPLDTVFARWCAEEGLVEDITAPHGEAFKAGYHAAVNEVLAICTRKPLTPAQVLEAKAATSIPAMRELLSNLHHEIDNMGGREGDLMEEAEETLRWLLGEYMQRGELVVE